MRTKDEMRAALKTLGGGRPDGSAEMTGLILQSALFHKAKTVLGFFGVAPEPDTLPLLRAALEGGKRLCLPKTYGGGEMDARLVNSLHDLAPGRFGILEPTDGCVMAPKEEIDLILVPALAFDEGGYRLGHGAGYYDRYLDGFAGVTLGLCFESRLIKKIPVAGYDLPVMYIATEKRLIPACKTEVDHV